MKTTSALSTVLARLRTPDPGELVQVCFTGSPTAVVAIARALAQVVVVTGMSHTPTTGERIRLEATCYHPDRTGRRS